MNIVVNGLNVRYDQAGAGEDVILLHGWGGRADSFAPLSRDLANTHRVTAVDLAGHGGSDEPIDAWGAEEFAAQVIGLMDALHIKKAALIGHSHGGRVSLQIASEHPERVTRMILTGCAGLKPRRDARYYVRTYTFKTLKCLYTCGISKAVLGHARSEELTLALRKRFGSADYNAASDNMKRTFVKLINQDMSEILPKIKAPTLLIYGENDTATPVYMGEYLEKHIPDAGLVVLKGAGHFAYLEKYSEFLIVTEHFLDP